MKLLVLCILFAQSFYTLGAINDIFEGKTSIEDPAGLRDPFQPPKFPSQAQKRRSQANEGVWNNQEKLEGPVDLEDIKITGVLIGTNRRVVLKVGDDSTAYTLREGETVGPLGPEIKAILPGGIILAEKINNIYGEPEYIETVIPISN